MKTGALSRGGPNSQRTFLPSKIRDRAHALGAPLFLAFFFLPFLAGAITLPTTAGLELKSGGKLVVTGTALLPAAQLYTVTLDLSGSASGDFVQYLGSGNISLRAALASNFGSAIATNVLGATLANLSGKLPATLASGPAYQYYYVMMGGSTGYITSRGIFSLKIDRKGKFTGSITHQSFTLTVGRKKTAITGGFTATSGSVAIQPSLVSSSTAQPDIMIMANPHVVIGNNVYINTANGSTIPFYQALRRGASHTATFLVQNDGPAAETMLFQVASQPAGITLHAYDGRTDITTQALGAGYSIPNLAPGAIKPIKIQIKVGRTVPNLSYEVIACSAKDNSTIDWAGFPFYVP